MSLARNLDLACVAEGVETPEQLQFLQKQMCGELQGYFYSPAVPEQECTEMLRRGKPEFIMLPNGTEAIMSERLA